MELEPYYYYFVMAKTLNMGNVKYKRADLNQYSPIKYQRLYGTIISILYNMGGNVLVILHIYGSRANSLLICDHQDTES